MGDAELRKADRPQGTLSIVERAYYDVSFNAAKNNPAWTLHRLTQGRTMKKFDRDGKPLAGAFLLPFRRDSALDSAAPSIYDGTGYDTGHMAPCEAMQFDRIALEESFLTSNCCSQLPGLNRGPWRTLERRCFDAAKSGMELAIIAGPLYMQAEGTRLHGTGPVIPDAFFKVVICHASKSVACYIMPNAEHVDSSLETHYVGLAQVAHLSRLSFPSAAGYADDPRLLDPKPRLLLQALKALNGDKAAKVENLFNGEYVLLEDFIADPADADFPAERVRIPKGFVTDFGSIPQLAQNVYPPIGTFRDPCFILHDWLYATEYFSWADVAYKAVAADGCRAECDWRLLCALQKAGDNWWNRNVIWSSVKAGGGSVWKKHTAEGIAANRALLTGEA